MERRTRRRRKRKKTILTEEEKKMNEIKEKEKKLKELEEKRRSLKKDIKELKKKKPNMFIRKLDVSNETTKYKNKTDDELVSLIVGKRKNFDEDSLSFFPREDLIELLIELKNKGGRPCKQIKSPEIINMCAVKKINSEGFLKYRKVLNFENIKKDFSGWRFTKYKTVYTYFPLFF